METGDGRTALTNTGGNLVHFTRAYWFAGFCIGFALAGFFDGILLHQVLQWHSLLSSLDGEIFQDLRFRMLTDGLFHVVMYLIGVLGLWLLWRTRAQFDAEGAGMRFWATLLIGFGTWHLIDAVLNHWTLGLHHIREDQNRLLWDLIFFVLGLACVGAGVWIRRDQPPGGRRRGSLRGAATAALLAAFVIGTGAMAAVPFNDTKSVTVIFKQGITPAQVAAAMQSVDGRMIWNNPDGDIWTFQVENRAKALKLYGHGALFVSGSVFGMGCFSATPAPTV